MGFFRTEDPIGTTPPVYATPSVVQFAGAYATGTTVTVTLATAPVAGNHLHAVIGEFTELAIPDTTGFSCFFQALEAVAFGGNWVVLGGFKRVVQSGDGTSWTFNVGDGVHIGAVALYEITPFIVGGFATQGTDTGSGQFNTPPAYPPSTALGIGAAIAFPLTTSGIAIQSGYCLPNFGWPTVADLELYDPTGVQYGAMTVTANIAGNPIFSSQQAAVDFNYTEINAQNAYNLAAMLLLVAP